MGGSDIKLTVERNLSGKALSIPRVTETTNHCINTYSLLRERTLDLARRLSHSAATMHPQTLLHCGLVLEEP